MTGFENDHSGRCAGLRNGADVVSVSNLYSLHLQLCDLRAGSLQLLVSAEFPRIRFAGAVR